MKRTVLSILAMSFALTLAGQPAHACEGTLRMNNYTSETLYPQMCWVQREGKKVWKRVFSCQTEFDYWRDYEMKPGARNQPVPLSVFSMPKNKKFTVRVKFHANDRQNGAVRWGYSNLTSCRAPGDHQMNIR